MKKTLAIFLISLFLISNQTTTYAKDTTNFIPLSTNVNNNETVIYADEDITITESPTFEENRSKIQALSTQKYVSPTRKYNIKNSSGTLLAVYTLNATFTYNGKTVSCTKSSCSTTIKNKNASFTSTSAGKSGSTATGKYTLKIKSTGKTISNSVSITCSKNGTIS